MSKKYHKKMKCFFDGWYLKQQNGEEAIAFIPAVTADEEGRTSGSLQVITKDHSWEIKYPMKEVWIDPNRVSIRLGKNLFSDRGCILHIHTEELELEGKMLFDQVSVPRWNIMGPFAWVPFLQCRHKLFSMKHQVRGILHLNRRELVFDNGLGYIEGDKGSSFPDQYMWIQAMNQDISFMVAAASVPILGSSILGCLGFVKIHGHVYRIGTYFGARVLHVGNNNILIKQGKYLLSLRGDGQQACFLKAPVQGKLSRQVRESVCAKVSCSFIIGEKVLINQKFTKGGFECGGF